MAAILDFCDLFRKKYFQMSFSLSISLKTLEYLTQNVLYLLQISYLPYRVL